MGVPHYIYQAVYKGSLPPKYSPCTSAPGRNMYTARQLVPLVVQVTMRSGTHFTHWRMVRFTHVNPVQPVSDLQVGVDAVFVNVTDDRHVGNSVRGFGALGDEARAVENGASSHRLSPGRIAHALSRSRLTPNSRVGGAAHIASHERMTIHYYIHTSSIQKIKL